MEAAVKPRLVLPSGPIIERWPSWAPDEGAWDWRMARRGILYAGVNGPRLADELRARAGRPLSSWGVIGPWLAPDGRGPVVPYDPSLWDPKTRGPVSARRGPLALGCLVWSVIALDGEVAVAHWQAGPDQEAMLLLESATRAAEAFDATARWARDEGRSFTRLLSASPLTAR